MSEKHGLVAIVTVVRVCGVWGDIIIKFFCVSLAYQVLKLQSQKVVDHFLFSIDCLATEKFPCQHVCYLTGGKQVHHSVGLETVQNCPFICF